MKNLEQTRKEIDKMCADVEVETANKAFWFRMDENGDFVGGISKFLADIKEVGAGNSRCNGSRYKYDSCFHNPRNLR